MKRKKPASEPMSTIIVPVNQLAKRDRASGGIRFLFWSILIAAALSRIILLDRASYMIDEINVVRDAAQAKSYSDIWNTEVQRFTSYHRLPMLMMILRASIDAFGQAGKYFPSEVSTRFPLAVIGIASILLMYLLGREMRDRRLGLWLMFLTAFNTFHVFYSREAYDYPMVIFFTTGVLWAGLRMLHRWEWEQAVDYRDVILYALFSAGLLQAHLSGLLFLGPWSAIIVLHLLWDPQKRKALKGSALVLWMVALGAGFVPFLPFLVRVFGFQATEAATANRFSLSIFPQLFGRMGLGEAWWALLPFLLFIGLGVLEAKRSAERRIHLVLGLAALSYLAVQTYMLRVSRFEVRYFSALFPFMMLYAGLGLDFLGQWISEKRKQIATPLPHLVMAVPLLAWMLVNVWTVCQLDCRSANYKRLANWVIANLPPNGIYSFWNGYEARGVPAVYQTPGRFMAYPAVWSSEEDYIRMQIRQRLTSFFLRFPLACYVEFAPDDVLVPDLPHNEPIQRDKLFANRIWVTDPAYQRLVKWKTLPCGTAQWYSSKMDHIYICYNKVEDLPKLASERGQILYHYFGEEWSYGKDQQQNDWLIIANSGSFYVGNVSAQPVMANVRLNVMSPPSGCEISIYAPNGTKLLERAPVPGNFSEIIVSNVVVIPGKTQFELEVLPTPASLHPQLLLYSLKPELSTAVP